MAGVYEVPPTDSSSNAPKLYDTVEDDDNVEHLETLSQLVQEVDLSQPPPPDAPRDVQDAYYDALAKQAQANKNKDMQTEKMELHHKPMGKEAKEATIKPSDEQRRLLMEQAMSGTSTPSQSTSASTRSKKDGPSAEERKKLLERAMHEATSGSKSSTVKSTTSTSSLSGPSKEQRMELMKQAGLQQKNAVEKEGPYSVVKKAPTKEQREAMAQAAMKSSPSLHRKNEGSPSLPRKGGPTEEQRKKLLEQAMQGSTRRAGPTDQERQDQRQRLLEQAMSQNTSKSTRSTGAPSKEDRLRLAQEAMRR
eukprot:m.163537 g.163537  ORF g.163537 m.163537 type:complete len:307 (+) comp31294_c1_seq2:35-955(+)